MISQTVCPWRGDEVMIVLITCTLDDGAGRHIKLRPAPISLVHIKTQQSLLVKTFAHEHSFI